MTLWRLLTGTLARYLLLAVNIALGVFLMPFTIRHLGTADYGLWMLVASFTAYFQLLDLGYGSGVVRHLADADARDDAEGFNRIVTTFVGVYAGIGLLAAIGVAAIVLVVIPRFPRLSPADVRTAQALLALAGIRIVVGFPMTVFGAVTTARQRFASNTLIAVAIALANGAATYVVLASGRGLLTLVATTTTISLLGYVAYGWNARIACRRMRIARALWTPSLVRDVTAFSLYVFLIDIAIQIGFNLDNVIIAAALGTPAVAVYAVAARLADYQRQLCNQFNGLLFPVVVRQRAGGGREALRATLVDGTRIALTLVAGVTIGVIGFGAPLVERWLGPGFDGSVVPLYVLALTGVVLVGQGPLGNVLLGSGRHRLVAWTSLGESLANLALSLVLVRRFGIAGVAIGTSIPVAVANLFILLPNACRRVGLPVGAVLRDVGVAPLLGSIPAVAVTTAFRIWLPPHSVAGIVAEGAAVGAVYVLSVWTIGFNTPTRERYSSHARQLAASIPAGRLRTVGA